MSGHAGLMEDEPWFSSLQGNILKAHGRDHVAYVTLSFGQEDCSDALRAWIADLPVTSFEAQLAEAKTHRSDKRTPPFVSFMLSARGYEALGYSAGSVPQDPSFLDGMKAAGGRLGDPQPSEWDKSFVGSVDALLLVGDDDRDELARTLESLIDAFTATCETGVVAGMEFGEMLRDEGGFVRNHFGFRDGISNPLFLKSDIDNFSPGDDPVGFDPRAGKALVLTEDPNAPGTYGSYVVIRKLEQNVKGFRNAEMCLAKELGLLESQADLVGAYAVGRFRDGTPVALSSAPDVALGDENGFSFVGDPHGGACPIHSHIRKVNDRGESLKKGAGYHDEKRRRIVRRGFAYGERTSPGVEGDIEALPEYGVGIHFLCYQSSIQEHFEHLQIQFSNDPDYLEKETGTDPIIGVESSSSTPQRWPSEWGDATSVKRLDFGSFVSLKGGEYFYVPSLSFLKSLKKKDSEASSCSRRGLPSTERTQALREALVEHCFGNRGDEWFKEDRLPDLIKDSPELASEPIIVRKALASHAMLEAMVAPANNDRTRTGEIRPGELVVGTMPLGSVGLGKTFPRYMTDDERRMSSLANRDEPSVFGHTTPNFERVLKRGLLDIIAFAREQGEKEVAAEQKDFYRSVAISCEAVVEYAYAFAEIAVRDAEAETDPDRRRELELIAETCRRVPAEPARNFREAVQCVWFLHLAQTAFCIFNSLGRLDQVLDPYLAHDLNSRELTEPQAVELIECFLMKAAERLHLNPATLLDSDNLSYGTGIGTQPIYLDQVASCNNFIQNIVLSGVGRDGEDATNDTTYVFLEATGNVGLCTPTVDVRLHSGSPPELLDAVDRAFRRARTGHPILFNDDSIVSGMVASGVPLEEARDYTIAGCWEPVLNGKSSFIFGMVNFLRVLECALNEGTLFNPDSQFLRGQKQSLASPRVEDYESFEDLLLEVSRHTRFFSDKVAIGTCTFFMLPGAMTPTPFMSALLDGCLERGTDQSLGGADFNLVSNISFGMPNAANALANIKRFVFDERRWTLRQVVEALRANWGLQGVSREYDPTPEPDADRAQRFFEIRQACLSGAAYGNDDEEVDGILKFLMDTWVDATSQSAELALHAFCSGPNDKEAEILRAMANYPAPSFRESMRSDFSIHFTAGSGTFGQYSSMGKGVSASADGRAAHDPVVPNCSPVSGSAHSGLEAWLSSLNKLGLSRLGSAVVTDIRIDGTEQRPGFFSDLARSWVKHEGSMLTVSVLSTVECQEMIRAADQVRSGNAEPESLAPYKDRFVRVGGWNSGFICLPRAQQRDHLIRSTW